MVVNLQTLVDGLRLSSHHSKSQKCKSVAFSNTKVESLDSENEEDDSKELILFVKKIQKLFKYQKPMNKGSSSSSKNVF